MSTDFFIGVTVTAVLAMFVYKIYEHINIIDTFEEAKFRKGSERARLYGRIGGLTSRGKRR